MTLLSVHNLHVNFKTHTKTVYAVRGVNFEIEPGEVVGIVGESGCGKSATAKAILGLLPRENSYVEQGTAYFNGTDLLDLEEHDLRKRRGSEISMVFQDPLSSLNPTMKVGKQIAEPLIIHKHFSRKRANRRAVELMHQVGIPNPESRFHQYPHELSGGQRQRICIAIALACDPKLLIADEPTTALDVTIQAQILELLKKERENLDMSIILITHDLSLVAGFCDRVLVMYAGEIVEAANCGDLFAKPKHPYTQSLLKSIPRPDIKLKKWLKTIPGQPPKPSKLKQNCAFCPRCPKAMNICALKPPPNYRVGEDHHAACWLHSRVDATEETPITTESKA